MTSTHKRYDLVGQDVQFFYNAALMVVGKLEGEFDQPAVAVEGVLCEWIIHQLFIQAVTTRIDNLYERTTLKRRDILPSIKEEDNVMTKIAYSYLRFRTPEQASGDSRRRQLAMAEKYATDNNLKLDRQLSFRDLGVSAFRGRNAKEGALRAFLEAIEHNLVPQGSVLLVNFWTA